MIKVLPNTPRLEGCAPRDRLMPGRGAGLVTRAIALGALAASLVGVSALIAPSAKPVRTEPSAQGAAVATEKAAARLAQVADQIAARAAEERLRSVTAATATAWARLEGPSGASEAAGAPPAIDSAMPSTPAAASDANPLPGWRDQAFANVVSVDGRTLQAGAVRIRLAGIELPREDEACRTLDGRIEPCAARAATQLELLIRHRKVHCHYRPADHAGDAVGQCRVGASDLAERMARTGLVRRTAEAARAAADN